MAVGDTIALSVMTPGHMQKIGLSGKVQDDKVMAKSKFGFMIKISKIKSK